MRCAGGPVADYELLFGLHLNGSRCDLRESARIAKGIHEAFSEVNSLELLKSLVVDPLQAEFVRQQQQAEEKLNADRHQPEVCEV